MREEPFTPPELPAGAPGAHGEDDDNGREDDSGHGNGGTRPPRPGPGPSGGQPGLGLPAGLAGSVNLSTAASPTTVWPGA